MKRNAFYFAALTLGMIALSGCANKLVHSVIKSGMTPYSDINSSMPKLNANYGRVIVFYQHHGLNPITMVSLKFDDYPYSCPLYNESYQYDDLPAGNHTILAEYEKYSTNLPVDLHPDETLYVEISDTANLAKEVIVGGASVGPLGLKVVDAKTALMILPHFVYPFERPMSCLSQQLQNVYEH
jgi:hypothetical protein